MLFTLVKKIPGKPWILVTAAVGIIWGIIVVESGAEEIRCVVLSDLYPDLKVTGFGLLGDWSYWDNSYPFGELFVASLKCPFVGVLECLISARIADTLTGKCINHFYFTLNIDTHITKI